MKLNNALSVALFALSCGLLLAMPLSARAADELELLSGAKMSGKVVTETADAITFDSNGAQVKLDAALIKAITVDGVRRELSAGNNAKGKQPVVAAAVNAGDEMKTFPELPAELRAKLLKMLDEAKKEAAKKISDGLELALAKHPKMAPEMAALMRNSSTQATWLKKVVDGAMTAERRGDLRTNLKATPRDLEGKWAFACDAISRMREIETGLDGAAFIEDYVSQALASSVGVLPVEPPPGTKPAPKHLVKRIQDNSGIVQPGGF